MRLAPTKLIRWAIGIASGILIGLWLAVFLLSRTPILHDELVQALSDKLDADVALDSFDVRTFPVLRIHGDGLKLRLKDQTNPAPFIEIRHFEVRGGLVNMLRHPRRFSSVELEGLRITIPPRTPHDKEAGGRAAIAVGGPIIVDHVEAKDATLTIVPKNPAKAPKVWPIHNLALQSVGFNRAMPFTATLGNAIPTGEIATKGTFGPWEKHDPGQTPVSGHYSFDRADLSTIDGIGGILKSIGDYTGELSEIDVRGTTTTPDFRLDIGGAAVPLDTTFHAVVDGTNGDTYLKQVDAKLLDTPIAASGAITSTPGVHGRTVTIDVDIANGHIQDVLKLAVSAAQPVMLGAIDLKAKLELPPGKTPVIDRLALAGRFAMHHAQFTDAGVQKQLATLSRHAQGKKNDEQVGRISSEMSGQFVLGGGVMRFDSLGFDVPGAEVDLAGHYGLRAQTLDFTGTFGMQASVSKAAGGGWKSFLLKPFDPLFRKHGKGAVIPITITGKREDPKFGVRWGKVFK